MSQSHGDIKLTIPAFGAEPRTIGGQFIYCKATTQPIIVRVAGQSVLMEPGDKSRYVLPFDSFEVQNPNSTEVDVTLVVGEGDYNRQIVQGTVQVSPGVKNAAGQYVPDTRHTLALAVWPKPNFSPVTMAERSETQFTSEIPRAGQAYLNGKFYQINTTAYSPNPWYIQEIDVRTGDVNTVFWANYASYRWLPGAASPDDSGSLWMIAYDNAGTLNIYDAAGLEAWKVAGDKVPGTYAYPVSFSTNPKLQLQWDPWAKRFIISNADEYGVTQPILIMDKSGNVKEISNPQSWKSIIPYDADNYLCTYYANDMVTDWGYQVVARGSLAAPRNPTIWPQAQANNFPTEACGIGPQRLFGNGSGNLVSWTAYKYTLTNSVRVTSAKQNGLMLALTEKNALDYIANDAAVTLTANGDGTTTLRGEVIKAALAGFLGGAPVPSDYLDHVYAIEATPPGGANWGGAWVQRQTNGETFAAARIADNFTVTLPGQIVLTVDNGIG